MHFTKIRSLGNDFLYVYGDVPENVRQWYPVRGQIRL